MQFCVNGRQPYSILKKADEVYVQYNDKDRIIDFVEHIPDKTIILDFPGGEEKEWKIWEMYSEKFKNFFIAVHNLYEAHEFNDANIKWYWPYPITSYYELKKVMELKPSYIKLGPPLSFDLKTVKRLVEDIPLRMVVNIASPIYLPVVNNGIQGQFVRPEDTILYEKYIKCFEFEEVDNSQEEALLHVYKDNKNWPGNLNLLIQRLNFNVDNRGIPEEWGPARVECGQKCQSGGRCKLCISLMNFADKLRKERHRRSQQTVVDNN